MLPMFGSMVFTAWSDTLPMFYYFKMTMSSWVHALNEPVHPASFHTGLNDRDPCSGATWQHLEVLSRSTGHADALRITALWGLIGDLWTLEQLKLMNNWLLTVKACSGQGCAKRHHTHSWTRLRSEMDVRGPQIELDWQSTSYEKALAL